MGKGKTDRVEGLGFRVVRVFLASQRPEVSEKVDGCHRVSNDRYWHNLLIYNDLKIPGTGWH